jgi:hypothetical protein
MPAEHEDGFLDPLVYHYFVRLHGRQDTPLDADLREVLERSMMTCRSNSSITAARVVWCAHTVTNAFIAAPAPADLVFKVPKLLTAPQLDRIAQMADRTATLLLAMNAEDSMNVTHVALGGKQVTGVKREKYAVAARCIADEFIPAVKKYTSAECGTDEERGAAADIGRYLFTIMMALGKTRDELVGYAEELIKVGS